MLKLTALVFAGMVALSTGARPDSLVPNLPISATSPMLANSCIYVAQSATQDAKMCIGGSLGSTMAAYFGAVAAINNGTDFASPSLTLTNLGGAPLASPALSGTPTAPTAAQGTSTTQLATTAFVKLQQGPPLTAGWIQGVNPGTACGTGCLVAASMRQAQNISALRCRLSATGDTGSTLRIYKVANGAACPAAGTVLHSGNCTLDTAVNTDQTLAVTSSTLAVGDSICIGTTGIVTNSAGAISLYMTPQ